ncbi:FtsX-like permease family protein [Hoeflea sp. TYP-13]|uniref:ABC transporter permease n=1 Tax=Hoeflea sp. TYP-13 TaxID=3230023 RepID=UPI0034C6BE84
MIAAGISALLSHWHYRPLQLATLIVGLALATGLWTGVQAINSEARSSYDRAAAVLGQDTLKRLQSKTGLPITADRFVALRRAGWLVSPVVEGTLRLGRTRVRVMGIDVFTLPQGATSFGLSGDTGIADIVAGNDLVLVHPETAEALSKSGLNLRTSLQVVPGDLMADIPTAWTLLKRQDFDYLLLASDQPAGLAPLSEIAPDLERIEPDPQGDIARLTDSFHLNLTAFGFLSFAVGLFIVHATIGLAFEQRRTVIRTLRALGMPNRTVILLLLTETLVLALIAGLLGVVLGYGIAAALLPDVAATLAGLYGASVPGSLALRPDWILTGLAIAFGGALLAVGQGLWRIARMPLLAPAQPRAWAMASLKNSRWTAFAAAVFLLMSLTTAWFGGGLSAGFLTLGTLLLGAAMLLPALLILALRLGARTARSAIAEWVWADMRQQVPGLSLALMALMLALAANIGVSTMVASFRYTFTGWLDQRLASELYVAADNEAEAEALRAFLAERADAVLPIRTTEIEIVGLPVFLYGIADHATYRDHWPLLERGENVWDRVAAGDGALINEQLFRRGGYRLGDRLPVAPGWTEEIVGIYSDYGNPTGQVIVSHDRLMRYFPDIPKLRHAVRVAPERAEALVAALVGEFGLSPGNILNQADLKRFSLRVFDRTFLVTGALNTLTLGIAGFAMLAKLLTLSTMRLSQMAPVWAVGTTRATLARLEMLRTVALAFLTWLVALPVGLALAWVLLAIVNVEAFGWRLPMHIFPADWLWLLVLAMIAAGFAAAIPVWRLARTRPAEFLKVFAHER